MNEGTDLRSRWASVAIAALLVVGLAAPAVGFAAQRVGRGRGRGGGRMGGLAGVVQPSQVWRLTTLSMAERHRLWELQMSLLDDFRDARDGGGAGNRDGRRQMMDRMQSLQRDLERIVGANQVDRAKSMPRGMLTPEELLYYPITSLPDLDAKRRVKIDVVFKAVLDDARSEADEGFGWRGRRVDDEQSVEPKDAAKREQRVGQQRQRRVALYDVLDALLTRDQLYTVRQFAPEQARMLGLRERIVMRMPTLTLEQESQVRALFAGLEDETAADKARLKAIQNELKGGSVSKDRREQLRSERSELDSKVADREAIAYKDLGKILTPEQMKDLQTMSPIPRPSGLFSPDSIGSLNLTAEQERTIRQAYMEFQRTTGEDRREARALREEAKDADPQSLEMAGTRDQLRQSAQVIDAGRDKLVRVIADTLTGDQLAKLVLDATKAKPRQQL